MNEEQKVYNEENSSDALIKAYNKIPYSLINEELGVTGNTQVNSSESKETLVEFTQICEYYSMYKKGVRFTTEGSNLDYIPANLRMKTAANLIDKEARFMFAESPDIIIEPKGDVGTVSKESKDAITVLTDLVKTILDKNMFEDALVKAAKDCFIGKRIAGIVNFNEEDGVVITFLPSTQFLYETKTGNPNVLSKFVCFIVVKDSINKSEKRIFKKKYTLEDDVVYLEEAMYTGTGALLNTVTEKQEILLKKIPACIFINDGLTGEDEGVSEIAELSNSEFWFSKLTNADMDADRKSMNPTKYTVDMESNSTANLSTAPGSLWDLGSDQNLDKPNPSVGILEPAMSYSQPLKTTLDRIKTGMHERVDVPNISVESMQGTLTSGKALKTIYWPLIVRCKEKMKMWGPRLRDMVEIIIDGAEVYPNCVKQYTEDVITPVAYEVKIEANIPLPEDEIEQKTIDLAEVESKTMSRKSYMKRWRGLTDDEIKEELNQIALEKQMLEDSVMPSTNDFAGTPIDEFELQEDESQE